jgi:hypothetical protein
VSGSDAQGLSALDQRMVEAFAVQISACDKSGAPFTADLLRALLRDFKAGGPWRGLIGGWPVDPQMDVVALRCQGALHRLALQGVEPFKGLFERFDRDPAALDGAVRAAGARPEVRDWIRNPPQTNEVMRSAVFLGGFFEIARAQGLPLRLLEMGASAGLNLNWPLYRYRLGETVWGPPDSPVRLEPQWEGPSPQAADIAIHSRRGVDQLPVDLADPQARFRLLSYVWADQGERMARIRGAQALARAHPATVDQGDAADWVEAQLQDLPQGATTVLYHSYVWLYLSEPTKARIRQALARAGARTDAATGLARLSFESVDGAENSQLTLTLWPGGEKRVLARAHPHGRWIKWLGSAPGMIS